MSKIIERSFLEESQKGYDPRRAREEAMRCILCHDAPCSAGCPAGTDPAKFIRSIRFGNVKGAAETIRENNILGGCCAKLCPYDRMCEEACSRCGIDVPIQIGRLQRFAVEQEEAFGMQILKAPAEKKRGKVACVGAGPVSLAVAAKLAMEGCAVTIYEALSGPGGMLSYGIIPARLPQRTVDFDIQQVKNLGVEFVFNTRVGKDIAFDKLKADYDAVFVGVGLWGPKLPDIPGIDLDGVVSAVEFLKEARELGGKMNPGNDVIVIGGGDVTMDCASAAKQLGAKRVTIVYRRSITEAPANMSELAYVQQMGVSMTTEMAPSEVFGENGKVVGMVFNSRDGYSGMKLKADKVVFAIGQALEDNQSGLSLTDKGYLAADEKGKTAVAGVFAAGDAVNGGATVVEAVAQGKETADSILVYLDEKVGAK